MTTQTDVKAKSFTQAGGALSIGKVRLKGLYFTTTVAGTIALTDGSATGFTLLSLTVPIGTQYLLFPGEGIVTAGDPYATVTTATGNFTLFYG